MINCWKSGITPNESENEKQSILKLYRSRMDLEKFAKFTLFGRTLRIALERIFKYCGNENSVMYVVSPFVLRNLRNSGMVWIPISKRVVKRLNESFNNTCKICAYASRIQMIEAAGKKGFQQRSVQTGPKPKVSDWRSGKTRLLLTNRRPRKK